MFALCSVFSHENFYLFIFKWRSVPRTFSSRGEVSKTFCPLYKCPRSGGLVLSAAGARRAERLGRRFAVGCAGQTIWAKAVRRPAKPALLRHVKTRMLVKRALLVITLYNFIFQVFPTGLVDIELRRSIRRN